MNSYLYKVALEEMSDLKEIWSELGKVTEQLEQMKQQSWQVIQPRKLRQSLDALRDEMKECSFILTLFQIFVMYENMRLIIRTESNNNMNIYAYGCSHERVFSELTCSKQ